MLCACAAHHAPQVERRIAGHESRGPFVPPHAYEHYLRGELALAQGAPEQAIEAFQLALAAPEVDPFVLSRLGLALGLRGDSRAAAQVLAEAEQLAPCLPQLWIVRGQLAERAGTAREALAHYQRALDCHPDDPEAHEALLRVLRAQGAGARARELEDERGGQTARVRLGRLLMLRRLSQHERLDMVEVALRADDIETLTRLYPTDSLCGSLPAPTCARLHARLGEHERAARAWASTAPPDPAFLGEAARSYERAGWWPEAELAAQAALEAGTSGEAWRTQRLRLLARVRFARGEVAGALAALPEGASDELAAWLVSAGLPGLAEELTARRAQTQGGD